MKGCKYGSHRVLEPKGTLPQASWRIDNTMELYDNEILVDVDTLNIDAASFTQIKKEAKGDNAEIARIMKGIDCEANIITRDRSEECSSAQSKQSGLILQYPY